MKKKHNDLNVERARHQMSQQDLAKAVGVTPQTISNVENGKAVPGIQLALKTAMFFRTSVEKLYRIE